MREFFYVGVAPARGLILARSRAAARWAKAVWLICLLASLLPSAYAQTTTRGFGNGANQFTMDFVTIGNPNNPADTTGQPNPAGSVAYTYNLGKHEVSRDMINKANAAGGLGITLPDMTSFGGNGINRPATGISWYEAAKYVNWLNTSTGGTAAYKFSGSTFQLWSAGDAGYNANNPFRNSLAKYWLPSSDEWYKGAYGSPSGTWYNFATGSDTIPTAVTGGTNASTAVYSQTSATGPADITNAGGLSAYGTMAQSGNIHEWMETATDGINNSAAENRDWRGGRWTDGGSSNLNASSRFNSLPTDENATILGFRVASADLTALDSDGDGLSDAVETNTGVFVSASDTGTNPNNPETDGDGISDDVEVNTLNSNPNDSQIPEALLAQQSGPNGFVATWGVVSGAAGYEVQVSTEPSFTSGLIGGDRPVSLGTTTSLGITGISNQIRYYRVRSVLPSLGGPLKTAWSPAVSAPDLSAFGKYATLNATGNADSFQAAVGSSANNSSYTISFWMRPDRLGGVSGSENVQVFRQPINSIASAANVDIDLLPDGSLVFGQRSEAGVEHFVSTPADTVLAGNWVHVTAVRDAANAALRLYINGAEIAAKSSAFGTNSWNIVNSGGPGATQAALNNDSNANRIRAAFDDVRIYRAVRTRAQILQDVSTPLAVAAANADSTLVFYAPMEGSSLVSTDVNTFFKGTLNDSGSGTITSQAVLMTPTLTWTPSPINLVAPAVLSTSELTATAGLTLMGPILPGIWSYSPAAGASLSVGTNTVVGTFVPTDLVTYAVGTITNQIVVTAAAKENPAVTVTTGSYTYNGSYQGPGVSEVNKGGSTGAVTLQYGGNAFGGAVYGPSSTPPTDAGNYTVVATVAEDANYNQASSSSTAFTIAKATATMTLGSLDQTYNGSPKPVTVTIDPVGVLFAVQYDGGSTVPRNAGDYPVLVTVNDPNYSGSKSGTLAIAKADPVIAAPPSASAITYGQALNDSVLTGGTSTPAGSFAFMAPTTKPNAGTADQGVTFTPGDADNYNSVATTISVLVNPAPLTITGISIANKEFDGTKAATINGTASYVGLVNGEIFAVTGTPTAVFLTPDVGNGKAVEVNGYTAPSANCTVTQPSGLTANITATAATDTDGDGISDVNEISWGMDPNAKQTAVYDFNSLSHGNLNGQDGWKTSVYGTGGDGQVITWTSNGSKAVQYNRSGSNFGVSGTRLNNAAYRFPQQGSGKTIVEIDVQPAYWGMVFGMGLDANEDGLFSTADIKNSSTSNTDMAWWVKFAGSANGWQFYSKGTAATTTGNSGTGNSLTYARVRVVLDYAANGGSGSASVFVRDLGVANSAFASVSGLQNLNLGLNAVATGVTNPRNWNGLGFHIEGATGVIDNLSISNDTDGDGLADQVETRTGTYVSATNTGTDPLDDDSDNDGLKDGEEVITYGTNPIIVDTDSDSLLDGAEVALGTNPTNPDTDGDKVPDGVEVTNETNPLNPASNPLPAITTQLLGGTKNQGDSWTFTVNATDPTATFLVYQWKKNGVNLGDGTFDNFLTISSLQLSDAGDYEVIVSNPLGSTTSSVVTLVVNLSADTTAPVVTLNGANPLQIYKGATFSDPGATVTDNVDASRTITGSGTVNTATVGNYTRTYNTTDAAGNPAVQVIRTVNVVLDPSGDEDGDGVTNGEETRVGTSPVDKPAFPGTSFAVTFNGSSTQRVIDPRPVQDDFTLAFWIKTAQAGTGSTHWYEGRGLLDGEVGGETNDFGTSLMAGGKIGFGVGNPDTTLKSTKSVNNSAWHHVVVSRNASSGLMKIYVDGVLDSSGTGPTGTKSAPDRLTLGSLQTNLNYFQGEMADFRIYDREISVADVWLLANRLSVSGSEAVATLLIDADSDGLDDAIDPDPTKPDTDEDGLTDGQEVNSYGSNPSLADTDGDGANDKLEVDLENSPTVANVYNRLINGSFEDGTVKPSSNNWRAVPQNDVPGWRTTANNEYTIELWYSGFLGSSGNVGNTLAELNYIANGTLYQDVTMTVNSPVSYSFLHRGREGNDVMDFKIDELSGGPGTSVVNNKFTRRVTTGTSWVRYSGSQATEVEAGKTYRFSYTSISPTGGNGNLLDDASFGVDQDGDGLTDSVETNTGTYVSANNTGTNPSNADYDNDGLNDGEEVITYGTNPVSEDTDGDGAPDGVEVTAGTNPKQNFSLPKPVITSQPVSITNTAGGSATFSVTATNPAGAPSGLTYQWKKNTNNISGQTNQTLNLAPLTVQQSGSYSVVVANIYGSTNSTVATLMVTKATPTITLIPTATPIAYGQTLAFSTLSGGVASVPGSFAWTAPATLPSAGTVSQGVTFNPTDTANYNTVTASVNVTVNQALISSGFSHTLYLGAGASTVTAWGMNTDGRLGVGDMNSPVNWAKAVQGIPLGYTVTGLAAGGTHSLILANGKVYAAGSDRFGQLGQGAVNGANKTSFTTVAIPSNTPVAVSAGGNHSLIVMADGKVYACGDNTYGQLAQPATTLSSGTLVEVVFPGLSTKIVSVVAGADHNLAVDEGGGVWVWGRNDSGQLGKNTRTLGVVADRTPVRIISSGAKSVAAGFAHSLVLKQDGTVLGFGRNTVGQVGQSSGTSYAKLPTPISGLSDIRLISAGTDSSFAIDQAGQLRSWGYNAYGELLLGYASPSSSPAVYGPTPSPIATNVFNVAGGGYSSLAVGAQGVIFGGRNDVGQAGNGPDPDEVVGDYYYGAGSLALTNLTMDLAGTTETLYDQIFVGNGAVTLNGILNLMFVGTYTGPVYGTPQTFDLIWAKNGIVFGTGYQLAFNQAGYLVESAVADKIVEGVSGKVLQATVRAVVNAADLAKAVQTANPVLHQVQSVSYKSTGLSSLSLGSEMEMIYSYERPTGGVMSGAEYFVGGTTYRVEYSPYLNSTWNSAQVTGTTVTPLGGGYERATLRISASGSAGFLRLEIVVPPET